MTFFRYCYLLTIYIHAFFPLQIPRLLNRDDRHIFFGRDREIEELYHRVFESKIMLVYGVSGTGKSSLINCGLANKFKYKPLTSLFLEVQALPLPEQKIVIEKRFLDWKGDNEQVDDVLILGFKI